MAASLGSSITALNSVNIDNCDRIYLAKDGDTISYSVQMSEFIEYLKKKSGIKKAFGRDYSVTLQQKYGYSATSTSSAFFDALAADCANRDFSKIELGDVMYMPVKWDGFTVSCWIVVAINHYDGINNYDETIKPGIVFRPCFGLLGTKEHSLDNSNSIGWKGSLIRAAFSGSSSSITNPNKTTSGSLNYLINKACNGHLNKISRRLGNTVSADNNWITDYAFLPSEVEVYGHDVFSTSARKSNSLIQFGLYSIAPHQILVCYAASSLTSFIPYWLCDPDTVNSSDAFCFVNDSGAASYMTASNFIGLVPCWYFGAGD